MILYLLCFTNYLSYLILGSSNFIFILDKKFEFYILLGSNNLFILYFDTNFCDYFVLACSNLFYFYYSFSLLIFIRE